MWLVVTNCGMFVRGLDRRVFPIAEWRRVSPRAQGKTRSGDGVDIPPPQVQPPCRVFGLPERDRQATAHRVGPQRSKVTSALIYVSFYVLHPEEVCGLHKCHRPCGNDRPALSLCDFHVVCDRGRGANFIRYASLYGYRT